MGQTSAAPNCSCPHEQAGVRDRAAYHAQFTGSSSPTHLQHLRNLEERSSSPGRCANTEDLVHPSLQRPSAAADLFTLGGGQRGCCGECSDTFQVLFDRQEEQGYPNYGHIGSTAVFAIADGQVLPEELPDQIGVPLDFQGLEYDWAAPSSMQKEPSAEQVQRLHSCLALFIRGMLAGVLLQLRLDPEETAGRPLGQNIDAVASLSRDLRVLLLSVKGVQRTVPLKSIRSVRPPAEEAGGLSWFLPSERDQMVVLRLAGSCFLRLRFDRREQAAYFGTCMRLLLKATNQ